jgi:hypothetical protein
MTKIKTSPQHQNLRKGKSVGKARPTPQPAENSKKEQLINLLSKRPGCDTASISKRFCWLPHTTRAALSRLRKAGYEITGMKVGTGKSTKYRIISAPSQQSAR